MAEHLPGLIGVDGLREVVRYQAGDHVGYELVIRSDCLGVIECLVAIATKRQAGLKLTRFESTNGELVTGLDSRYRVELSMQNLTGDRMAQEYWEAHAERCFLDAYAQQPEFAPYLKSAVPDRFLRKRIKERRSAPCGVWGGSRAASAKFPVGASQAETVCQCRLTRAGQQEDGGSFRHG